MSDRVGMQPGPQPGLAHGFQAGGGGGLAGRAPSDGRPPPTMQGSFRGEAVRAQESPLSLLQNAAEELTFGAAERMTKRELGDRRLERKEPSRQLERAERIQEYLDKLPDFDRAGVDRLLERLLDDRGGGGGAGGQPSREGLERALRGFSEDITYQQAALELLDETLSGRPDPAARDLRREVQALIAENNREMAPAIQAGLNVTRTAMLASSDARDVQDLRNFYRESVLSHESLGGSWRNIVGRYGDGDLGGRISFLLKAIGADLQARGPSIPPAELKAVLDEAHQLETLATIRERATGFLTRLHARFGGAAPGGRGG